MSRPFPSRLSMIDDVISARWSVPILRTLLEGPARFSRLRQAIPGMSSNILIARLRLLERRGIVEQARLPEPADRAVYRLTERGDAVRLVIEAIDDWALAWPDEPTPREGSAGSPP